MVGICKYDDMFKLETKDHFCYSIVMTMYFSPFNRNAQPIEKLKSAYKKFFARSLSKPKASEVRQ